VTKTVTDEEQKHDKEEKEMIKQEHEKLSKSLK